jgi:DNA polymerase
MEELRAEILQCTKCPLSKTRKHVIFGNGATDAPIMIIGEAPGADEDRQGIAFIGRAGQLLDKILAACNFTRDKHVFISNIVRCRPPGNRPPASEETAACFPYLDRQIVMIDPAIIVTLGATALKSMLGNQLKITKERGKWQYFGQRLLMPVYHPAALLRNPDLKKDTWEDFKNVVRKYREVVDPDHECKYL